MIGYPFYLSLGSLYVTHNFARNLSFIIFQWPQLSVAESNTMAFVFCLQCCRCRCRRRCMRYFSSAVPFRNWVSVSHGGRAKRRHLWISLIHIIKYSCQTYLHSLISVSDRELQRITSGESKENKTVNFHFAMGHVVKFCTNHEFNFYLI